MSMLLPRESVEQYRRDGFLFPIRIPVEARLYRARHVANMKRQAEILHRGTAAERFR